jgi:outer membrane lipoprotein SlyB
MKTFTRMIAAAATAALLAGCQTTTMGSGTANTYRSSEIGRPMNVTSACTVTDARYVRIQGDSRQDHARAQGSQVVGIAAGAVIGNAIGRQIGGGSGREIATVLGTVAGAAVGSGAAANAAERRSSSLGVEYTLAIGTGGRQAMRSIVQDLGQGEGVMSPGTPCRLIGTDYRTRVIPA